MESIITFKSGTLVLEGALNLCTKKRAAVISHPHPLYGGTMDNAVVLTIARAFYKKGFTTLRFNFRGVGGSEGRFDDGEGEKADVRSALAFLKDKGFFENTLAGYSFGARMNAMAVCEGLPVKDHVMISPPAGFMSFDEIGQMPDTGLIVTGARDEIAPPGVIQGHIDRWGIHPEFNVIEGCDHFYSGCLDELQSIIEAYLS